MGFPSWERYERRFEAPYVKGRWWDPYRQNVLKGDYPITGQHTTQSRWSYCCSSRTSLMKSGLTIASGSGTVHS
ncbi:MAG: hypothetical protein HYZ81_19755 [Nitrospinae bacterium]|nr:hypothetical protein [Nitrospinota bacterium]